MTSIRKEMAFEPYSDWPPEPAAECLAWFREKLTLVPSAHRDTATIVFSAEQDMCGNEAAVIVISWTEDSHDGS